MGWSPYTPKIDDSRINICEYYKKVCTEFEETPVKNLTTEEQLKYISDKLGYPVTRDNFVFELYAEVGDKDGETKKPKFGNISMKMFYNFLLQERAGGIPTTSKGPHQDLYEYKYRKNKNLKKCHREKLPSTDAVWNKKVNWNGYEWTIRPHPTSRTLTLERLDEKEKVIRVPFPEELRMPEKKVALLPAELELRLPWTHKI